VRGGSGSVRELLGGEAPLRLACEANGGRVVGSMALLGWSCAASVGSMALLGWACSASVGCMAPQGWVCGAGG